MNRGNKKVSWAVVVAQLVERSLPIAEVRGLIPVISKILFILNICLLRTVYLKDENKEKEARDGPFFKTKKFHCIVMVSSLEDRPLLID